MNEYKFFVNGSVVVCSFESLEQAAREVIADNPGAVVELAGEAGDQ